MLNYGSKIVISGAVGQIDQESRDVTVITKTPRGKDVAVVVHMWKTYGVNSDSSQHEGRDNWMDNIEVGKNIVIHGHMGNNGRVIAVGIAYPDEQLTQPMQVAEGIA